MILFLLAYWFVSIQSIAAVEKSAQLRLANDLFNGYKPSLIPLKNLQNGPLNVSVGFTLLRVQHLDERTQTLSSLGFITLKWTDELLMWDPHEYEEIQDLVLLPDDIWLPDIQVINSIDQPVDISLSSSIRFRPMVSYTGEVTWSPGQQWETYCPMNLIFFPFDRQICNITLVNFVNSKAGNVKLKVDSKEVARPTSTGPLTEEWGLADAYASILRIDFADSNSTNATTHSYFAATLSLELARVSSFYVYNIVIPIVIITQISTLVYLIPSESGEKISFSITLLLAYFVMLLMVSDLMPRAGSTIPYLTSYIVLCMFINGMSLFCTIIVLKVYHHNPHKRVPACIRFLGCCGCLKGTTVGKYVERKLKEELNDVTVNETTVDENPDVSTVGDKVDFSDKPNQKYIDEEDLIRNRKEWRQLANFMDKFFLICSMSFITGLTVIYFLVVSVAALDYQQLLQQIQDLSTSI